MVVIFELDIFVVVYSVRRFFRAEMMENEHDSENSVGIGNQASALSQGSSEHEENNFFENVIQAAAIGVAAVVTMATVIDSTDESNSDGQAPIKKKRIWARDWVLRRDPFALIYSEFSEEDPKKFRQCFRMSPEIFNRLLDSIFPFILKKDTVRDSIKPNLRLMVTLRFLASGCDYGNLEDSFKIPKSTISRIVSETCQALWELLSERYIRCPQTQAEWLEVAKGFKVSKSAAGPNQNCLRHVHAWS